MPHICLSIASAMTQFAGTKDIRSWNFTFPWGNIRSICPLKTWVWHFPTSLKYALLLAGSFWDTGSAHVHVSIHAWWIAQLLLFYKDEMRKKQTSVSLTFFDHLCKITITDSPFFLFHPLDWVCLLICFPLRNCNEHVWKCIKGSFDDFISEAGSVLLW